MVRVEDEEKYKSISDLDGMKIGAQKGTMQEDMALEMFPNSEIKSLGKITDLVLELKKTKSLVVLC